MLYYRRVFLPVYVMQLIAYLALAVASRYLGTTLNLVSGVLQRYKPNPNLQTRNPNTINHACCRAAN
jgi:hypothetical protein